MTVKKEKPKKLRQKTIHILWAAFILLLVVSVIIQAFIVPEAHFNLESEVWFYPVYGFGTSALFVLFSKGLGLLLQRPEKYWDEGKEP